MCVIAKGHLCPQRWPVSHNRCLCFTSLQTLTSDTWKRHSKFRADVSSITSISKFDISFTIWMNCHWCQELWHDALACVRYQTMVIPLSLKSWVCKFSIELPGQTNSWAPATRDILVISWLWVWAPSKSDGRARWSAEEVCAPGTCGGPGAGAPFETGQTYSWHGGTRMCAEVRRVLFKTDSWYPVSIHARKPWERAAKEISLQLRKPLSTKWGDFIRI